MTDHDERIAEQIARDVRLQAVRLGIDLEADFQKGRPLNAIINGFALDASAAFQEFATADLADIGEIRALQSRVYRSVRATQIMDTIRKQAATAEADLMAEQQQEEPDERD